MVKRSSLVILSALAFAKGHVAYWNTPNKLQPVHGLYVKPSMDGTTGDLYVAATEDNGMKSQWLTDQPVGFLPKATTHQNLPVGYNPNIALADDAINTQKRAVINSPLQYAYAYPVPGHPEGNSVVPYPYSIPTPNPTQANSEARTPLNSDTAVTTGMPQYQPLQYFYPQMMSAYADFLNAFKEKANTAASVAEADEESTTAANPQTPSLWPYAYPVQYLMVNPSTWAQSQAAAVSATPSTTTSATVDNE